MSEQLRAIFRNEIDLNRYSNSVAKRIIRSYNDVILDAVEQLRNIDEAAAPVKAARLRSLLAQLKSSLATWSGASTSEMARELQGLAVLQSEFAVDQLQKALPAGSSAVVSTVEISPAFAQAVVSAEPTAAGIVNLSDRFAQVPISSNTFQLTVGQELTLPNGQVVRQAFSRMAERQAEIFSLSVRNGILQGQSVNTIVRGLKGRLNRDQAGSIDTIIAAGGRATAIPNNQIRAIVRTSMNAVTNQAAAIVAAENADITESYRYTAVLDSKTSAICRALDGKIFKRGKGPEPPQHYNCRSRAIDIPTGLEEEFKDLREDYGLWLEGQSESVKRDVLGPGRLAMWDGLVKKYGASDAIRKFVAKDGSELTLVELRKRGYGSASG